jgi:hypothetical protein
MEERSDKEQQHITKHHNTKHNKRETTTQNKTQWETEVAEQ